MAAAYAALVSLTDLIHTIRNHPNPPITLHSHQVYSLLQKVSFLQEFLELHYHEDAYPTDGPESLIRDVAHAAEDAIESYIADQLGGGSTSDVEGRRNSFYQDLQKAIEDLDTAAKRAMQIEEMMEIDKARQRSMPNHSLAPPSLGQKSIMVGFDNVLMDILDKLTGQENKRKIIPIVGMGGIGKTTLALNAYEQALVVRHFDIRIWVTISQKFMAREILLKILYLINQENKKNFSERRSQRGIGEEIHKSFSGRRYLIVLDDIWSAKAWDEIRHYFPDNNNGSRIIITTRISSVAIQLSDSSGCQINLLSKEESWKLFCKHVFGEDDCPLDWEEIGKTIVSNCKGLPLSIVVIGRLLAKSERTKQHWEYVAKNLNSIVNLEDDEHCLRILHMSYKQLPIHLKPCFLYMGVYPEDSVIHVSELARQLVAEGFLKPIGRKSIEVVAKEYIKDLVDRNLIFVYGWKRTRNIKCCKMHDLLRDVCLREAQKEKFLYVKGEHNSGMNEARRFVFQRSTSISMKKHPSQDLGGFLPAPLARSLICRGECAVTDLNLKILRIWSVGTHESKENDNNLTVGEVFNLRYFDMQYLTSKYFDIIRHSTNILWNLQTLIFAGRGIGAVAPIEIWKMAQIRHIIVKNFGFQLPHPPDEKLILKQLQILGYVSRFKCNEKVLERIPNIKKLRISCDDDDDYDEDFDRRSNHCVNLCRKRKNYSLNINFKHLHQLEHLYYGHSSELRRYSKEILTFPCSLKKLYLEGYNLFWEDITTKVGPLPNLEKLTLRFIKGREWRPDEGQFPCLKYLKVYDCNELETLIVDETHFLLLEHLVLDSLYKLKEIPSIIGEISTLKSIQVNYCIYSAIRSAKKIIEEQEELGNSNLVVTVSGRLPGRSAEPVKRQFSYNFWWKTTNSREDKEKNAEEEKEGIDQMVKLIARQERAEGLEPPPRLSLMEGTSP